ncbi:hypothetical protein CK203_087458 [Vitis vinifera]|uniref:Uncharacterized protein n=1 Tax=Vitis vinifera TaxID=29760 RepID=A0A438ENB0_VITVI|nr:hypothetical protein CK203_087458 [Vitis vinifera]
MGSEAKSNGGNGGFRSRMEYYLYSGDKKHVFAGIAIFSIAFGIPWYLMTRGSSFSCFVMALAFAVEAELRTLLKLLHNAEKFVYGEEYFCHFLDDKRVGNSLAVCVSFQRDLVHF